MRFSLNRDKFKEKFNIVLKEGDHVLYTRFSISGEYNQPIVLEIIDNEKFNARSFKGSHQLSETIYKFGSIIHTIDIDEIEPCSINTRPEYYV